MCTEEDKVHIRCWTTLSLKCLVECTAKEEILALNRSGMMEVGQHLDLCRNGSEKNLR